jgi:hypothetical protein
MKRRRGKGEGGRGKGEVQHECYIFVDFIWFYVMMAHSMNVFSPSENFGIRLFHFSLECLALF